MTYKDKLLRIGGAPPTQLDITVFDDAILDHKNRRILVEVARPQFLVNDLLRAMTKYAVSLWPRTTAIQIGEAASWARNPDLKSLSLMNHTFIVGRQPHEGRSFALLARTPEHIVLFLSFGRLFVQATIPVILPAARTRLSAPIFKKLRYVPSTLQPSSAYTVHVGDEVLPKGNVQIAIEPTDPEKVRAIFGEDGNDGY